MKRNQFTEEQIIRSLKEHEAEISVAATYQTHDFMQCHCPQVESQIRRHGH